MSLEQSLQTRSDNKCELCTSTNDLLVYTVPPSIDKTTDNSLLICTSCQGQIEDPEKVDVNHWRCLNDSMWSTERPVQVMAWRMLNRLHDEGWPVDLLDMLYLDDETLEWAKTGQSIAGEEVENHVDSNGAVLSSGDSVTLIKSLDVKGGGFTAKRGTSVRNISLVEDNVGHIEGKINGQRIVILTKFVKKA